MRIWSALAGFFALVVGPVLGGDTVVLLHGLGRGPASMQPVAFTLKNAGYAVANLRYPSQTEDVATLAEQTLGPVFAAAADQPAGSVHVVTHSLGGILVRQYLQKHGAPPSLGRVVMLAPPNGGSEIVDTLAGWRAYAWLNGPAGLDLGTAAAQAPRRLGALPAGVEVGVIAGSASWNPWFSAFIPGPDDGKVAVASTHVAGEADHLVLPYSHTWLMNRAETRRQILAFLRDGRFDREAKR